MKRFPLGVVVLAGLTAAVFASCTSSSSSSSSSSGGVNRPDAGASSGNTGSSNAGGSANAGGSSNGGASSTAGGSSNGGVTSTAGGSSNGGVTSTAGGSSNGGVTSTAGGSSGGGSSGAAVDSTITAIQGATPPATGSCVRVQAVVMSVVFDDGDDEFNNIPRRAFYISEKNLTTTAPRTGIQVSANDNFMPRPAVNPGDDVTITAQYQENFDLSLLRLTTTCGGITVNGTGLMLPAPAALTIEQVGTMGASAGCPVTGTDGPAAEDYEGVLFTLTTGTVTTATNFGETEIGNGGYNIIVKPGNGSYTGAVGATIPTITGFGHNSFCRRKVRPFLAAPTECGTGPRADHLLITEIAVTPSAGEFVEIHNPTANTIDLSNYRLYNATFPGTAASSSGGGTSSSGGAGSSSGGAGSSSGGATPGCGYWAVANPALGRNECGEAFGDFSLKFPAGSSIGAGEYKVIAVTSAANWCATNGACAAGKPDFEIPPPATGCAALTDDATVPNMEGRWDNTNPQTFCNAPPPGGGANAGPFGFLTNASEDMVLFTWDGAAAIVQDVDYVVWGTSESVRSDKTGLGTYLADTPVASQSPAPAGPGNGNSLQRKCLNEGTEQRTPSNGLTGHNETSEPLANTFVTATTTPRAGTVGALP